METFIPSHEKFSKLINQSGGSIDRYIYRQSGSGLGNFFAKAFRFAKPILTKSINTLRPTLEQIGNNLIDSGTSAAVSKIENLSSKAKQGIKRKRDNLDNE